MHEKTSAAEMKRLFGKVADQFMALDVPGMELDTVHKYALNILVDHRPEEELARSEAVEKMRRNQTLVNAGFNSAGQFSTTVMGGDVFC